MNGRWFDRRRRPPALRHAVAAARLGAGDRRADAAASSCGWSASRGPRNDPGLPQLGPDPLRPGFDVAEAAARACAAIGAGREVGDALLDQRHHRRDRQRDPQRGAASRPDQPLAQGRGPEPRTSSSSVVAESERIMRVSIASGRRPRSIYRAEPRGCPRCGGRVALAGPGRRQPHRLLVPALPDLSAPASGTRPRAMGEESHRAARARAAVRGAVRARSSSGSRRSRSRARSRRASASSTRATTPTPATSSARRPAGHPRALRRPRDRAGDARPRRHLRRAGDARRRHPLGQRRDAHRLRAAGAARHRTCAGCSPTTATSRRS